jgi:hypothetical protein
MGYDLNVDTFDDALARGRRLLAAQPEAEDFRGIEIWHRARLVYSDDCYADSVPVISPFQTGEGTMSPPGVRPSSTFTHNSVGRI